MAYLKKLASGNWQTQIRLKGLKPITRTFSTKTKAKEFAREIEGNSELARKMGVPTTHVITFSQLVEIYLKQFTGKDPSVFGRLKFWVDRFGDKPVTTIDEFMVDDGLVHLSKKCTGSTVNRYKSQLSAVFIFFIQHPDYKRLGFTNPVRKESVSRYPENPAKNRFLADDEQQALLSACRKATWNRMYLLVLMGLTTGARKGELLGLKWFDVDFDKRTGLVAVSKNGKPKLLPLTQPVILELMKIRENTNSLVFCSTVSRTTPYDIRKLWLKALKESGIGHIRFHDLRHTAASNLVRHGRTLFEVSTLLGHSNTTITGRYAHLAIDDTLNMVDSVMGGLQ
jgi:integrase